ncbi:amino acid permease-domain-containing protein [Lasiosphaeria ovina]|uniref:Amino acid permease-domain-containing protein n=1 Tax=Lasiosphaeria ovina TaxID=92902 RepID=A0AAE0K4D2_9PEZI|nr:amino acid permease-domain-containing protein [Lasiosphaeria ovina]
MADSQQRDIEMTEIGSAAAVAVGGGPYRPQEDPTEIERDPLETGALETFDVFALIVNKMIGTGIYSAPATIFMLTGRKWLTLVLFFIGFIHSLLSTTMYLDYASVWPYTGGELIYIDEITADKVEYPPEIQPAEHPSQHIRALRGTSHGIEPAVRKRAADTTATAITEGTNVVVTQHATLRQRFFGDGLLPFITFSVLFVAIFNSGTNSMQTGRMILLGIAAKEPGSPDVHRDVVRLLGVVILTILSLLQYSSARFGRKLNRFLVVIKLLFMFALFLTAMVALKDPLKNPDGTVVSRVQDWSRAYPVNSELYFAKALLAVLFSFDGWENATFVVGELPRNGEQRELRKGFYWAVFTVGCTYVIIVGVVLNSLTWDGINTENVYYAPLLTGNGSAAKLSWSIVGAISALGSLNSVIYTFSRVKQAIGQANVLPWSNVWKKDDILQRGPIISDNTVDNSIKKTPQGGLILHWTLSVAVIAGSSWIPSTIESVNVPGFFQAYTHCFILMVLGCTYHRLQSREAALTPPASGPRMNRATTTDGRFQPYKWNHTALRTVRFILVVAYVLLNFAILLINVIPPYKGSDGTFNSFPGYAFLVTVAALVLFSVIYYITIFGAAKRIYPSSSDHDTSTRVEKQGLLEPKNKLNLLRLANVTCEIEKDRYFNMRLERVYRFGRRWRIRLHVPGDRPPVSTAQNSQVNGDARAGAANREPHPPLTWATFWYWLFGGGRLADPPDEKFGRWWDRYVGL